MKLEDIAALQSGDQVYWNDPDDGLCSRMYTIESITSHSETGVVTITEKDGSVIDAYFNELS